LSDSCCYHNLLSVFIIFTICCRILTLSPSIGWFLLFLSIESFVEFLLVVSESLVGFCCYHHLKSDFWFYQSVLSGFCCNHHLMSGFLLVVSVFCRFFCCYHLLMSGWLWLFVGCIRVFHRFLLLSLPNVRFLLFLSLSIIKFLFNHLMSGFCWLCPSLLSVNVVITT